jgi:hypothetical protein
MSASLEPEMFLSPEEAFCEETATAAHIATEQLTP